MSQQDQSEFSLEIQEEQCRKLCEEKGFEILEVIQDNGASGDTLDREGLKRVLELANQKKYDRLVIWKLDRMSRRLRHTCEILEEVLDPNDIKLVSYNEPFLSTDTPFGMAIIQFMATFAELDRKQILHKTREGKIKSMEKNKWPGRMPYGYKKDARGGLVLKDGEVGMVRQIFNYYTKAGLNIIDIVNRLNKQLISGPGKGKWNRQSVHQILRRDLYTGETIIGKGKIKAPTKFRCPPIITKKRFDAVQLKKVENYNLATHNLKHDYIFRGIIYCGACEKSLFPGYRTNKKKKDVAFYKYRHRKPGEKKCEFCSSITELKLARAICNFFYYHMKNKKLDDLIKMFSNNNEIDKTQIKFDIKALEQEKLRMSDKMDRLAELYSEGLITKQKLNHRIGECKIKLDSLDTRVLEKKRLLLETDEAKEDRERIKRLAKLVKGVFKDKHLPRMSKEDILEQARILVCHSKFEVLYVHFNKKMLEIHLSEQHTKPVLQCLDCSESTVSDNFKSLALPIS